MLRVALLLQLLALGACSGPVRLPWPSNYELGQHRALIKLPNTSRLAPGNGAAAAAWVTVPWQRRHIPDTDSTNAVLTLASTGEVVANVLRAPVANIASREAMHFIFEPSIVSAGGDDNWLNNNGTADRSIVTNCSGAQRVTLACWKADAAERRRLRHSANPVRIKNIAPWEHHDEFKPADRAHEYRP